MRAIRAKQSNTFVLHGVPADLVPVRGAVRACASCRSTTSSPSELFAGWPSILTYNRAEGLGFATPAARAPLPGAPARLRRGPRHQLGGGAAARRRQLLRPARLLLPPLRRAASRRGRWSLLLPFAETVVPAAEVAYRTPEDRAVLVYLRKWSQDPVLLAKNIVIVMVTESLAELDPKLLRSHATREVEILRPDAAERLEYLEAVRSRRVVRRACRSCRRRASPS